MTRVVVWGYHSGQYPEILQETVASKQLDVVAWFGKHRECTHDVRDFYTLQTDCAGIFRGSSDAIYRRTYQKMEFLFESMLRGSAAYGRTYHEMLQVLNCYFDFFYNLLTEGRVELVLFDSMPHLVADVILYQVAKELEIATLIPCQSIIPNRFFYVYDIDDFGYFHTAGERPLAEPLIVPQTFRKQLLHMPERQLDALRGSPLNPRIAWQKIRRKLSRKNKHLPRSPWSRSLKSLERLAKRAARGKWPDVKLSSLVKAHTAQATYLREIEGCFDGKVELDKPFVYFPMHLQPEMTTSTIGGEYCDQLLALERLRTLLPADWTIYVKENPVQGWYRRGPLFFRRVRQIPRTQIVPREYDTYALLENCQFVATITGTAGWEAISGGKPALVFGKAWYRMLPGVVEYRHDLDVDEILATSFSHDQLQAAFNRMMRKSRPGIYAMAFRPYVPDFSFQQNKQHIACFLSEEIDRFRGSDQLQKLRRSVA